MIYLKLVILISLLSLVFISSSKSQPNVYVDPANKVVYGQKTVAVNFRISNVTNLGSYNVIFKFNNSVLKYKSSSRGNFLSNNGSYSTIFIPVQQAADSLNIAEAILGGGLSVSGSGFLFSVQFDILATGQSSTSIKAVTLFDINNNLINNSFTSGYVTIVGKVLVVDDNVTANYKNLKSPPGSSASLFNSSLTSEGYFTDQVNFSSLNTNTLSNYDVIILSAGVKESSIFNDPNKRNALINYTLAGGKTLIEGGDVGNIFSFNTYGDPDPEFRRNLLLDSNWISDRIGANLQITNSNHPIFKIPNNISSPSTISINNGGSSGSGARDEMTLLTKTGISRIANWVGGIPENGGIIVYNTNGDTSKCRNVFYSFSIANCNDQTLAGKLIINTMSYMMRDVESPTKILNIRFLIEGFYNGTKQISDSVTVELREASSPYNLVDTKTFVSDSLGYRTLIYSTIEQTKPYYLVLKHRNSIETWSSIGNKFNSGFLNYDFTTDSAKAFGNNMKKKGTKWCIYSGDVNKDGFVNSSDLILISSDAFNYSAGYRAADLTGDNYIDLTDLVICDNNFYNSVRLLKP